MHRLYLFRRGKTLAPMSPLDMTLNHQMINFQPLEIWRMLSTPSLPLLSGSLWPGVVAPDRVLSMGQKEQTLYKQMTDVKLWLLYSNTWNL